MPISYFLTFLSIILGLSVSILLESVGTYIKAKNKYEAQIKHSIPWLIIVTTLIILTIQYFIAIYILTKDEGNTQWILHGLNISITVIIFIISRIISPDFNAQDVLKKLDSKENRDGIIREENSLFLSKYSLKHNEYSMFEFLERNIRSIQLIAKIMIILYILNSVALGYYKIEKNHSILIFRILIQIIAAVTIWNLHKFKSNITSESGEQKEKSETTESSKEENSKSSILKYLRLEEIMEYPKPILLFLRKTIVLLGLSIIFTLTTMYGITMENKKSNEVITKNNKREKEKNSLTIQKLDSICNKLKLNYLENKSNINNATIDSYLINNKVSFDTIIEIKR